MSNVNKKAISRRKASGWDNSWRKDKFMTTIVLDKELAADGKRYLADRAEERGHRLSFNGLIAELLNTHLVKAGYRQK